MPKKKRSEKSKLSELGSCAAHELSVLVHELSRRGVTDSLLVGALFGAAYAMGQRAGMTADQFVAEACKMTKLIDSLTPNELTGYRRSMSEYRRRAMKLDQAAIRAEVIQLQEKLGELKKQADRLYFTTTWVKTSEELPPVGVRVLGDNFEFWERTEDKWILDRAEVPWGPTWWFVPPPVPDGVVIKEVNK